MVKQTKVFGRCSAEDNLVAGLCVLRDDGLGVPYDLVRSGMAASPSAVRETCVPSSLPGLAKYARRLLACFLNFRLHHHARSFGTCKRSLRKNRGRWRLNGLRFAFSKWE
jgi:hypothetical protein